LSIAGSDSSAGAGIQADIKTVHSLGGYCLTALTSVTSQNSKEIYDVFNLSKNLIFSQINAINNDIGFDSVKVGLIPNFEVAKELSSFLKNKKIPIVIDPVFKATVGKKFVPKLEYKKCQKEFFRTNTLITPNILEMEILTDIKIKTHCDMYSAIKKLSQITDQTILLKGGDVKSDKCLDLLFYKKKFFEFCSPRINKSSTHGTGCTLSTAITFFLGKGFTMKKSVLKARKYLFKTIKNAPNFNLKYGPLGH
tara:strand:- start:253 stop:1008 length:756 start_codon:yes stop_codon:yes gene_type:complete